MARHSDDGPWADREDTGTERVALADRGDEGAMLACPSASMALVWQPVRDVRPGGAILYHEGLVRFPETDGWDAAPHATLAMIERCGGSLSFDRLIVRRVIEALRSDPVAVLGVNLSAASTDPDGWSDVVAMLRSDREIAHRLIVEITETAPFADIDRAASFCAQLQACGVRVALDDFGAGHSSVATALALQPAIIKIDGAFVQQAGASATGAALFRHLVGIARSIGALTIVEGVETREQADIAQDAGSLWQQGYFHGRPMRLRPARTQADFIAWSDPAHRAGTGLFTPISWR